MKQHYRNARTNNYEEPWVSYTHDVERVDHNKTEEEKLLGMPLTFEVISDGNICLMVNNGNAPKTKVLYSINNGDWAELLPKANDTASFPIVNGDVVKFKGDNPTYCSYSSFTAYYTYFNSTCKYRIKGNIMSLIDSTNFASLKELQSGYTFYGLFSDKGLIDAGELLLPATTLANNCYHRMFYGCSGLTAAPALPSTTLAYSCYADMFRSCIGITTAPALPATTLSNWCYFDMFTGCTSLTTTPELPATTLASSCYTMMFNGCTSLTQAPALPATAMTSDCYQAMFDGCTSLTTAPVLPATTLVNGCYEYMFSGCTNLNYIKCLATNISASNCTRFWLTGVASTGTFVKDPNMSSWPTSPYVNSGIPTGWTVQDA